MISSLYKTFQRWCEKGSIYIISDTHFDDENCKLIDPNWITPEEHINKIKKVAHKNDTLICLGDTGDASYFDKLKCYKVLITGNHDKLSEVKNHFDEIYTGPLFIADRILLSHEPIFGLPFCYNIHGHCHQDNSCDYNHKNLASNIYNYEIFNLGQEIKNGLLSNVESIHRVTINEATLRKEARNELFKNSN